MRRKLAMLRSEKRVGEGEMRRQGEAEMRGSGEGISPSPHLRLSPSPLLPVLLLLAGLLITAGCRRDMQDQPKMKPFRGTTFFADGLSGRQPIEGTVPRGFLRTDTEYFTGKKSASSALPSASPTTGQAIAGQNATANAFADDT